jgi:hypothetical protein
MLETEAYLTIIIYDHKTFIVEATGGSINFCVISTQSWWACWKTQISLKHDWQADSVYA